MLTAGGEHTCGLASTGAAYCWGLNLSGQVGDQTHTNRPTPTAVAGGLTFETLAAGGTYTCGLTADGSAYCWGWNQFHQLGDSGGVDQSAPTPVKGGLKFQSINGNFAHTCAVTSAGTAYCWGSNDHGQLGTGDNLDYWTPMAVSGGLVFAAVEAGYSHTCGVTALGDGYCWGRNQNGQLGAGDSVGGQDQLAPIAIHGGLQWSMISSGAYFNCGVEGAGSAYCWGINQSGQLGANSATTCFDELGNPYQCALSPLAVGGGLAFAEVSVSTQHACAITPAGVVYCWGLNTYGQLGNGEQGDNMLSIDPVKVSGQP
jgi:alpha-tubulin suppressor-like RCC1 family protein